ncbi:MAG: hypothetical protein JEZ06_08275 [Anaerolineaceae bacterium]|nr:hypothetical protein [Anaerolineaceae bacterium]
MTHDKWQIIVIFFVLLILSITACTFQLEQTIEDENYFTSTPTNTLTSTVTPVWFPPTKTPTQFKTKIIVPTKDQRIDLGDVIFRDQFLSDSFWFTGMTSDGNISVENNELTLAISEPGERLSTLRSSPLLSDYYLEVTAKTHLCRDVDNYGVIFRHESAAYYYRLVLSCNGYFRVERIKDGRITVLSDWIRSGQIPIGSPAVIEIGIWSYDEEIRIFFNDVYQLNLFNIKPIIGSIGFYARSGGENALTVTFEELSVMEISP